MSILDIFRKKKEVKEEAIKSITLDKLDSLINEKAKNLDEKSENLKKEIKEIIHQFALEINEKMPALKSINLEKRREPERLKETVLGNLSLYISYLEKLINNLEEIGDKETKEYIQDVQSVFNNFSRNSGNNFEKATILIGDELRGVKDIIMNFTRSFDEKIGPNKNIFEERELINNLKKSLDELKNTEEIQIQIEGSIKNIEDKISRLIKEKQPAEKDFENYRKSKEYNKFLEEQEKIEQENKNLNDEILKLKQEIDLKSLLKYFHSDKKKSKIIEGYYKNFANSLKEDNNIEIINIAKQANQNVNEDKIKELKERIMEQKMPSENKEIKEFGDKIKKIEQEISYEKDYIEQEKSKKQRFEEKQKQILFQIKEKTIQIWSNAQIDF